MKCEEYRIGVIALAGTSVWRHDQLKCNIEIGEDTKRVTK